MSRPTKATAQMESSTKRWTKKKKDEYLRRKCSDAWYRLCKGLYEDEEEEDFLLFHPTHLGSIANTERSLLAIGVNLPWISKKGSATKRKNGRPSKPKRTSPRNHKKPRRSSRLQQQPK